jgi:cell division protein FtsB
MNSRLKTIRIITASLLVFIILLIIALTINVASWVRTNNRVKFLESELARRTEVSSGLKDEIEYKDTDEYKELIARERLRMIRKGETAVTGK